MPPPEDGEHRVFRDGGISYLRIPAEDPRRSGDFYRAVFVLAIGAGVALASAGHDSGADEQDAATVQRTETTAPAATHDEQTVASDEQQGDEGDHPRHHRKHHKHHKKAHAAADTQAEQPAPAVAQAPAQAPAPAPAQDDSDNESSNVQSKGVQQQSGDDQEQGDDQDNEGDDQDNEGDDQQKADEQDNEGDDHESGDDGDGGDD